MSDLISKQDAIKALDAEFRCTDNSDDWNGLKTAMLIIEELPSVPSDMTIAYLKGVEDGKDAVRKTGHWKVQTINGKPLTYCSECGFGKHVDETRRYSYCPNCGTEMKGEKNEAD